MVRLCFLIEVDVMASIVGQVDMRVMGVTLGGVVVQQRTQQGQEQGQDGSRQQQTVEKGRSKRPASQVTAELSSLFLRAVPVDYHIPMLAASFMDPKTPGWSGTMSVRQPQL